MKCCNCGAELESGVAFCRECGEKVEVQRMKKRFCRECGTEFAEGVKYCSNCGANTDVVNGTNDRQVNAFQTNRQAKRIKPTPNSRVTNSNETMKYIVFAIVAVLTVLITMSLLLGKDAGNKFTDTNQQVANRNFDKIIPVVKSDATIEASTEYAYMSDEWNVYTARAISDLVVKVEHWDKTLASTKNMDYNRDIGTFKITDPVNGFSWIDDEHTAFTLTIQDKNNSRVKKALPVIFTINISDSDKFKGTNYDEKIACYLYTNDDWHMYRAIALTDNLIKIECWARTSSLDKFCFGWDVGVIDLANNSTDFKWGDNEHTAFTITMCDSQNKSYWKSAE
ncbi:MAG: hypothetical protein GX660_00445, partial [Clostridiaceae bacterium]|nr:hypothetical protein [Clostridiaceae bacterium]